MSSSQINLSWNPSTDSGGSGLAGYRIYQSGTQTGSTAATSYSQTGLSANIQYCFTVAAYDNAGNVSGQSVQACAVTGSVSVQPWSKSFGSTSNDAGQAVAFDSGGNLIMAGYFQGTADFGCGPLTSNSTTYSDIVLAKYSSSTGACLWSKRIGGSLDDKGQGVTVDANDNVIVTGYFFGTVDFGGGSVTGTRGYNIFVAKYAADGTYQWARSYGSTSGGDNKAYAVAVDSSGNIGITGTFQNTIDFGNGPITAGGLYRAVFVGKLSTDGVMLWSKGFGGSLDDYGQGIALDSGGNAVVTGQFQGTVDFGCGTLNSAGGDDIFVLKYSSSGGCTWLKQFGDVSNQEALSTAVDSSGNVILTGPFMGTVNFGGGPLTNSSSFYPDIFVAKLSPSGTYVWSKGLGGTSSDQGRSVTVDSSGNVVITGYIVGAVDLGGGLVSNTGLSTFVAKYSSSGVYQSARAFAGAASNQGNAVAIDRNGYIGLTGWFQGDINFGQGTLFNSGALDAFLMKGTP